uniref:30S ribosomal protein S13 n=1 Tax=Cavernulicola chilensis TaxID=3028028 RepID=A0A7H0WB89_9RHOD|nr:30S ribosomal protein S13 [Cavernulicola chilensis]QNR39818.1 30S ribosomal protein S13 [Cavernulicola chilensis]
MFRLLGVTINEQEPIASTLTRVFGIGRQDARILCQSLNLAPQTKCTNISGYKISLLSELVRRNCTVLGERRSIIKNNISLLKSLHCYKGVRHRERLPVRGQRTRSNAVTARKSQHNGVPGSY